jgi:hypothetical protein
VLIAVLSLAAVLAIEVPYLPQTDALCGGAAAAMVLRYWGEAHADAQEFAPLVDRRAGGIANGVLTAAVSTRGWRTERVDGTLAAIDARLRDRQPVIVLLPDRGDRYHYVVITGASEEAIIIHDPAWGPSRTIRAPDFERMWKASGYWSLVILPRLAGSASSQTHPTPESPPATARALVNPSGADGACEARLNHALDEIRSQGLDRADALLGNVRAQCPGAAGPIRELSGARFAQRRWSDAAALAREALRLQPRDEYALDVLGSSLFMLNDDIGALRAWNQIGKPRVNRVRIEGLHHVRYQTVAEVMAIQPNMLLTADVFARARRRLGELPDHAATRLAVKPETDGFATVDVVVVELAAVPRGAVEWAGFAARTAANEEVDVSVPGVSGQGEVWTAGWRWWSNRPGVSLGFAAPRVGRLPGVWRFDGSWQSDTYSGEVSFPGARCGVRSATCEGIVETRTHGGLTVSDWLAHGVRYAVSTGVDAWSGGRKSASIGAALEHVAFADRLSVSVNATQWAPLTGESPFRSLGARISARSSAGTQGWVTRGSIGVERVSDAAPLALWPGAGEGQVRAPLLRAHPLLSDGVVDLTSASAFGRTLAFGSAEVQRWFEHPTIARLGVAVFTDVARASRQAADGRTPVYVDAGAGLRIKIPGTPGVLRADVAHGLRDGANALTFGWLF